VAKERAEIERLQGELAKLQAKADALREKPAAKKPAE
jgi:hypothetical protein